MVAELQIVSSLCHMPLIRKARKRSSENRNRLVRFLTRSRVSRCSIISVCYVSSFSSIWITRI